MEKNKSLKFIELWFNEFMSL